MNMIKKSEVDVKIDASVSYTNVVLFPAISASNGINRIEMYEGKSDPKSSKFDKEYGIDCAFIYDNGRKQPVAMRHRFACNFRDFTVRTFVVSGKETELDKRLQQFKTELAGIAHKFVSIVAFCNRNGTQVQEVYSVNYKELCEFAHNGISQHKYFPISNNDGTGFVAVPIDDLIKAGIKVTKL